MRSAGHSVVLAASYAAGARGAREAARNGAVVVVVDAFRASTTISVLVEKGARVVPAASIEEAVSYPGADYRIGERGSKKVQGFDFGNSPTEIRGAKLRPGATVVLSTTNGTRITEAARSAPYVFIGAFVNARAVADELLSGAYGTRVAVIGCGWRGYRSSEDEAAAGAILSRLGEGGRGSMDGRSASRTCTSRAPKSPCVKIAPPNASNASAMARTSASASPRIPCRSSPASKGKPL